MSQPMLTSHTHTMTRLTLNEATHAFRLVHDEFGSLRVVAYADLISSRKDIPVDDLRVWLWKGIALMPRRRRAVMRALIRSGFDTAAVAVRFGTTESNIRHHVHGAIQAYRRRAALGCLPPGWPEYFPNRPSAPGAVRCMRACFQQLTPHQQRRGLRKFNHALSHALRTGQGFACARRTRPAPTKEARGCNPLAPKGE